MSDPISMSFSLNQQVLNAAIAAALPSLIKDLEIDYTSGRAPKGLTAQVTLTEAMIRKAVESYARRTVAATFTHFGIDFQATRGEDGIVANITASTAPIAPDAEPAKAAPRPSHEDVGTKAERPDTSPVARAAATPAAAPEAAASAAVETAELVEDKAEVAGVADVAQDTGAAAPFETEQTADAAIVAPADAPAEAAAVEVAAVTETPSAATPAPAPAAGRSRLFADLKRPSNDKPAT